MPTTPRWISRRDLAVPRMNSPVPEPAEHREPAETATATAVTERPAPTPARPPIEHLPPFRVLLHNDDVNEIGYVVDSVLELTPLNKQQAVVATLEAHQSGVALLLVTHQERAELYREQLLSRSLTVTIEPAV